MPHFVNQNDIPMAQRVKHINRYRNQLRAALANPALTPDQRSFIKARLDSLGKTKTYDPNSPPPPGAIDPTTGSPPEPIRLDETALNRLVKSDVFTMGRAEGAPISLDMTKTQMIEAIINNR